MSAALRIAASMVLLAAGLLGPAWGGALDNFPPVPGWSHATPFEPDDGPFRHGVLLDARAPLLQSPVIADTDGDPSNGLEVAFGTLDGVLHVLGANGTTRWEYNLTQPGCDAGAILPTSIMPAVAPIFGDGVPYVLMGYGGTAGNGCDGGVVALDGRTGALAWRFSTLEWEKHEGYPKENLHGVVVTPAAADTDGDGRMEIAFGSFDRNFYLLEADGTVRWYYHAADTVWSSPRFVQLDDDAPLEVVTASDVSLPHDGGGFIEAFDTGPRYPKRIEFGTGFIWRTQNLGQVPYSSPAIADVLPDEPGDEIVIGNGCYFPPNGGDRPGKWVKIFRLRDGAELKTLDLPPGGTCSSSSPAVGDIDDDGRLEVVVTNGDASDDGGDQVGRVVAWDPENATPKWSTVLHHPMSPPGDPGGNDKSQGFFMSPVIADLDGNGSLEVVVGNYWSVHVLDGRTGTPLTCQSDACGAQPTMFAWGTVKGTPAIADLDGDGTLDVVTVGMHVYSPAGAGFGPSERAMAYAWTGFAGLLGSRPGAQTPYAAPWPMLHGRMDQRPTGGGGRVTDFCGGVPAVSVDRFHCRLSLFLDTVPCTLPPKVASWLTRADKYATASAKRAPRRMLRKAVRALARAQRFVPTVVDESCRASLQATLDEIGPLLTSLAAAAPRK
jgi:outer membrane protein assembly factor BamB